jgi:putative transposase
VLRYIHRNLLQAGVASQLKDFAWSSHQGYLSKAKKWDWLHRDFLLSMLSEKKTRRKSAYINFLSNEEPEEIKRFYSLKSIPSILGNNLFKEWIKEKFSSLLLKEEIPESRELSPLPENIIALVCDYFKVTNEQILMSRRGTENLPGYRNLSSSSS